MCGSGYLLSQAGWTDVNLTYLLLKWDYPCLPALSPRRTSSFQSSTFQSSRQVRTQILGTHTAMRGSVVLLTSAHQ